MKLTPTIIANATGSTLMNASQWCEHLQAAIDKWGISDDAKKVAMFLAQAGVESTHLTKLEEDLRYSAPRLLVVFRPHFHDLADAEAVARAGPHAIANRVYAGRLGNGNEASGDGWKHRGMGIFQLTGAAEQAAYLADADYPADTQPETVLLSMAGAADSAGWFWQQNGLDYPASMGDVQECTRIINGKWLEALTARQALYEQGLASIDPSQVVA